MRQSIEPSASERVADWIRHVADRTGKRTLEEQAAALGVTKQSLSRWKRGAGLPSLTQLYKILDQARVPAKTRTAVLALREQADQERRQRRDDEVPPPPPPAVVEPSWWERRRKIVAPAVLATVLVAGVLVGVLIAEGNPVSATCDHYEVTAETLYRRDADGTPLDFFHKGERLDVVSRHGKYWYVTTADGTTGWVLPDPRWIRPRCQPSFLPPPSLSA